MENIFDNEKRLTEKKMKEILKITKMEIPEVYDSLSKLTAHDYQQMARIIKHQEDTVDELEDRAIRAEILLEAIKNSKSGVDLTKLQKKFDKLFEDMFNEDLSEWLKNHRAKQK